MERSSRRLIALDASTYIQFKYSITWIPNSDLLRNPSTLLGTLPLSSKADYKRKYVHFGIQAEIQNFGKQNTDH